MTPDGAASGDGPGRLDLGGLGVIRRIRPVNLEYAGTTAARLPAASWLTVRMGRPGAVLLVNAACLR